MAPRVGELKIKKPNRTRRINLSEKGKWDIMEKGTSDLTEDAAAPLTGKFERQRRCER